jgi:primosomal protein N' (replication factor Y) (superfamily II helicase)
MKVLRVALDVPLATLFDYARTDDVDASVGDRVVVPFGTRSRVGVVAEDAGDTTIDPARLKPVQRVLDDAPRLPAQWLEFMRFLAGYYHRPLGETVIGALPPRLRSLKPLPKKIREAAAAPDASPLFVTDHTPTPEQAQAIERIRGALGGYQPLLLHGVTGSGKTEVYLSVIARVLEQGRQALVMVPEISLTPQLEERFRRAFPHARIAMLHSALEDVPRTADWLAAARGEAGIVLGTRLAVLTPMPRLGLVVVDEEHDTSFKQQEGCAIRRETRRWCAPSSRAARWRSAPPRRRWRRGTTPWKAAMSAWRCRSGRTGARLPAVRTVDLRNETVEQGFAPSVLAAIGERLARGEQSLVFINRRGYAPVLACHACGWTAGCERCTARMVLHRVGRCLRCHHCGDEAPIPRACPTCGNLDLKAMGRGTQRVEDTLVARFPGARIVRIDRDSAQRRAELARTLQSVARGEADILVGTQLLAKGHDFPLLTLVAVLDADNALVSTDYRAAERLYATLAQVAGRAGRALRPGEVLVQTRYPQHPLYGALARHDFEAFAAAQLAERESAGFPPFVHEAALRAEAPKLAQALEFLESAARLVPVPEEVQVYDPVPHVITRRADLERAQLLVQSASRPALQEFLRAWSERLFAGAPRSVRWHLDVDPIEFS